SGRDRHARRLGFQHRPLRARRRLRTDRRAHSRPGRHRPDGAPTARPSSHDLYRARGLAGHLRPAGRTGNRLGRRLERGWCRELRFEAHLKPSTSTEEVMRRILKGALLTAMLALLGIPATAATRTGGLTLIGAD